MSETDDEITAWHRWRRQTQRVTLEACPYCDAREGDPCVTSGGRVIPFYGSWHAKRLDAAGIGRDDVRGPIWPSGRRPWSALPIDTDGIVGPAPPLPAWVDALKSDHDASKAFAAICKVQGWDDGSDQGV